MRTVMACIFDYSLDGIVSEEGASFFDFCRDLPYDPIQIIHERDFMRIRLLAVIHLPRPH